MAQAIDAISANSDHETKTQTEQAFQAAFVSQFADIGLIVGAIMGAVFFTLILLTGNTMAQAVRERIPELAVLKTIGFSNRSVLALVLAESVLLLVLGGAVGLAAGRGGGERIARARWARSMPMLPVGGATWLRGLALMVADRAHGRGAAGAARHAPAHRRCAGGALSTRMSNTFGSAHAHPDRRWRRRRAAGGAALVAAGARLLLVAVAG